MAAHCGTELCPICFRDPVRLKCVDSECRFGAMCSSCFQSHHRDANHKVVELQAASIIDRCDPVVAKRFAQVKDLSEFQEVSESDLINAIRSFEFSDFDNAELLRQLECKCAKCSCVMPHLKLVTMTTCGCELCSACFRSFLQGLPSRADCPACRTAWSSDAVSREFLRIQVYELEAVMGSDEAGRMLQMLDDWREPEGAEAVSPRESSDQSATATPSAEESQISDYCNLCGSNLARMQCTVDSCVARRLCNDCDQLLHNHPARKDHSRTAINMQTDQLGDNSVKPNSIAWSCLHCTFENALKCDIDYTRHWRIACQVCNSVHSLSDIIELIKSSTGRKFCVKCCSLNDPLSAGCQLCMSTRRNNAAASTNQSIEGPTNQRELINNPETIGSSAGSGAYSVQGQLMPAGSGIESLPPSFPRGTVHGSKVSGSSQLRSCCKCHQTSMVDVCASVFQCSHSDCKAVTCCSCSGEIKTPGFCQKCHRPDSGRSNLEDSVCGHALMPSSSDDSYLWCDTCKRIACKRCRRVIRSMGHHHC